MDDNRPMQSRLASFVVWAAVAASLVYWGFTVAGPRTPLPDGARLPAPESLAGGGWSQVLGVAAEPDDEDEPAMADDSRFQLLGVVAPQGAAQSSQGVALIAVDGQPPRAVRTGAVVEGDTVLLAVERRAAQLGPRGGPATVALNLPEPDTVARGPAIPIRGAPMVAPAPPMRPLGPGAVHQQVAAPLPPQTEPALMEEEEEEE